MENLDQTAKQSIELGLRRLPESRQHLLREQFISSMSTVDRSDSEGRQRVVSLFLQRVESETRSYDRVRRRAKELHAEEAATRRIALALTALLFACTVGAGLYLADDKRLYHVHEFFAKWYYYLFVQDPKKGNRLFLDKEENYDMYA